MSHVYTFKNNIGYESPLNGSQTRRYANPAGFAGTGIQCPPAAGDTNEMQSRAADGNCRFKHGIYIFVSKRYPGPCIQCRSLFAPVFLVPVPLNRSSLMFFPEYLRHIVFENGSRALRDGCGPVQDLVDIKRFLCPALFFWPGGGRSNLSGQ